MCDINYQIFASFAYVQDMHLQKTPCVAYCVTLKTAKLLRGSTSEKSFDADACDLSVP